MDDKTGICKQGKFPVFNVLKRELTRLSPTTQSPARTLGFPRGFWSKRPQRTSSSSVSMYYNFSKLAKLISLNLHTLFSLYVYTIFK